MHLFRSVLAILGCLVSWSTVVSAVAFTSWPTDLHTGQPATLEWAGDPNIPVTITLQKGPADNLKDVKVLTADAQGGSFTFVPGDTLAQSPNYAFKITQDGQVNYSGQVTIAGGPTHGPMATNALTTEAASSTASLSQSSTQMTSMTTTGSTTQSESTSTTASDTTATTGTTSATSEMSTASDTQMTSTSHASSTSNVPVRTNSTTMASSTATTQSTEGANSTVAPGAKTQMGTGSLPELSLTLLLGAVGLVVYDM